MYRFFERLLDPIAAPPAGDLPPRLLAFYWHFAKQATGVFVLFFIVSLIQALLETSIPYCIGKLVGILAKTPRDALLTTAG